MRGARWFVLFIFVLGVPSVSFASDIQNTPIERINLAQNRADDSTKEELLLFYEEKDLVVATKRPVSLRKAPAIATIITSDEIKNMGARNLMDVLKMVPGIGISIDEFGRYMFEVRGIRTTMSEKIIVMIDGHKLNEPYTGSALAYTFPDIPVENIKQVEIIKGPASALYGANAFLAVINIVTNNAADINGAEASAAGGSFGTRKFNITGGRELGDLHISGSIDYMDADGAKLLIQRDRLSALLPAVTKTPGMTDMSLEKTDIFLKALYKDFELKGHYMQRTGGSYIGYNYALTNGDSKRYDNYWLELSHNKILSSDVSVKSKLYLDYFILDSNLRFMPAGFPGFPDGMRVNTYLENRTLGAEMQGNIKCSEGNTLIIGAAYENVEQFDVRLQANFNPLTNVPLPYQDVSSIGNFQKNAERNIYALYLQDEWMMKENLTATLGVRYDHYSDFGDTLNPRLAVVWAPVDDIDLKFLYGQAFRAPNFKELYDQNNRFSLGNPNLFPEKIKTYEASAGYRRGYLRFEANGFLSKITALIDRDTSASTPIWANKGSAEVKGIEVSLTGKYSVSDYWKLGYIYQHPKDTATGQRLPYVPSHRATASLNYGLSRYLISHIDVLWTGSRPRASGDTREKAPSYTTVDLALIAKNIYKNLEIKGTIHNLFNQRYNDPDTSGVLKLIPYDFPREGISGLISIGYKF